MSPKPAAREYESYEPTFPYIEDVGIKEWRSRLKQLAWSAPTIREATISGEDGRKMKDLQAACEPIGILSVRKNVETIAVQQVLLAEVEGVHVGFCVSSPGPQVTDPLFVQTIGVDPLARSRGIGFALLSAAAEREPHRNIAFATLNYNTGAHASTSRFARADGSSIHKVKLGTYLDTHLGITRGMGYRVWLVRRHATSDPT
ncbi:Acetyltransferase (GNAT) family protein [compost metagenome]